MNAAETAALKEKEITEVIATAKGPKTDRLAAQKVDH